MDHLRRTGWRILIRAYRAMLELAVLNRAFRPILVVAVVMWIGILIIKPMIGLLEVPLVVTAPIVAIQTNYQLERLAAAYDRLRGRDSGSRLVDGLFMSIVGVSIYVWLLLGFWIISSFVG